MLGRWSPRVGIAFAGLLLAGCGPLIIASKPDTFTVPPEAVAHVRGPQNVALNNAYKAATETKIFIGPREWVADLQQYTDTAMVMLGKEMGRKAVTVVPQASKTITLRVYDVQARPGWTIQCSLALDAQYGDGTRSTIRTQNASPSDAWRAIDGAIMFAVSRLLRDDQFLAYVNK